MTTTSALPAHVGTVLADRYELVRHIARGGMGDVYEATDRLLDRPVAVKLFRAAPRADRQRFDAEVRTLAGLNHPVLVRVYDAGSHDDDAFVVLELIAGPPLSDCLHDRGPVPSAEVAALASDLADALAYIHARGVVHRDVTPSNVLCPPEGRARLLDFGIARLLEAPRVTATAVTIGTACYMAPEQVQGRDVTPAADVYASGLVLLEALTGRREFSGPVHEVVAARLTREPDTSTGVPEAWRPLLTAMCARDADRRPSAAAVRDHVRAMTAEAGDPEVTAAITAPLTALAPTGAITAPIHAGPPTSVLAVPLWSERATPVRRPARSSRGAVLALVAAAAAVALFVLIAAARGPGGDPSDPVGVSPSTEVTSATQTRSTSAQRSVATTVPTTTPTTAAPVVSVVVPPEAVDPPSTDFDPFAGSPIGQQDAVVPDANPDG